ncbi:hypothetical protein CI238_13162 [Colletotrichum incanum]|uniref:Uncharacterized protein n=1 Tax=Colletotrichum incanum TaxID=1573173 RepID=A0A162NRN2_COLIC|nr:hypothetical protein CI238_13162 [Colletotrichum incanum]
MTPTTMQSPSGGIFITRLSGEKTQERAEILSELHDALPTSNLQAYFADLKSRPPAWDIETFIEGAMVLSDLIGHKRAAYYDNPLKGPHSLNSFTQSWNKMHSQHPITMWDQDIRRQCPPTWFNGLIDDNWVLSYRGEAPLSQGLNELLQGPTTLDCGMWCQFLLWMSLRYLIGDELFDSWIPLKNGRFALTQMWGDPMNDNGTIGSLLYSFYDEHGQDSQARIQTRTVSNHPTYSMKHPGGMGSLQNVTQVDGRNLVFDPSAPQNVLSETELKQKLLDDFNAPQDSADLEKQLLYKLHPSLVHPHFHPKTFGTLAEEAEKHANDVLDEDEWSVRQEDDVLCLDFNLPRLVSWIQQNKKIKLVRNSNWRMSRGTAT